MRIPRRLAAPVVAAVVAVVAVTSLAACGSSTSGGSVTQAAPTSNGVESLSADEILAKAKEAALKQSSVYIVGKGGSGSSALGLDLKLVKGGGATGSIESAGDKLTLVTTSTHIYIKADKAFWAKNSTAAAAELIGDRWVKVPADNEQWSSLGNFGNFDKILTEMLSPSSTITKGETSEVNGTKAIGLKSSNGTLWVATTGDPLPLRIDAQEGGQLNLKDWGAKVDVVVPADADVIDIAKLQTSS